MIFGYPLSLILGQVLLGLINGAFYAILSLGLAVIFGMLRVINFAHGAMYMLGGFTSWSLLYYFGIGYWWALLLSPLIVGIFAAFLERAFVSRIYKLDHLFGLLVTFGFVLVIEGTLIYFYGAGGRPYPTPDVLTGTFDIRVMFLPKYRLWIVAASLVVTFGVWLLIERTKLGSYLRAATEDSVLVEVFGINVRRLMTLTYAIGGGLAAFAGVLAAPVYQVSPLMGQNLIIVAFAVVVIGGMGSILGAILTGYAIGVLEGLTKVFYPEMSSTVIFIAMVIVLLTRPAGLFGKEV